MITENRTPESGILALESGAICRAVVLQSNVKHHVMLTVSD